MIPEFPTPQKITICSIILNQTGTNNPTQTIKLNSLKLQITWTRSTAGVYLGATDKPLKPQITQLWISNQNNVFTIQSILLINEQLIQLAQRNTNTTAFEDELLNYPIEIRQYNT